MTGLNSALNARTHATVPTDAPLFQYDVKNFIPAKLRLIIRSPNDGNRESRITGVGYKAANSDSLTKAFGRKTANEAVGSIYTDVISSADSWVSQQSGTQSRSKKMLEEGAAEWQRSLML